ncbi:MAG: ribosome-associated translation inhibitor RaiA [Deltaproteobacteria bacterium]|nr:ribosome-associated translation inhibitor RaiA [Deltaproteobacteria bacterium]
MQVTTTFRHMETSQPVRQHALERLEKVRKYFTKEPLSGHAVFSVENNHQYTAELQITLPNGMLVQARETTEDMYSSIDLAGARLERQVRRWKDRISDHKPHGGPSFAVKNRIFSAEGMHGPYDKKHNGKAHAKADAELHSDGHNPPVAAGKAPAAPAAPPINVVREETFTARSMRVDDAVMQLSLLESDFLVFSDVESGLISVVYRRKDGNYGLIDTGAKVSTASAENA